ncbi:MAG: hypothetical protein V3S55_12260 [Nitrospiraceae bacterium]|jgi:hypothetical protein
MSFDKFSSLVTRLFFIGAFVLLIFAVTERAANIFGYTILQGYYTGGRLLEFSAILLIFVIALLLRQLREEVRKRRTS